jgi:hypothetical protein
MSTSLKTKQELKDYINLWFVNTDVIALLLSTLENPSIDFEKFAQDIQRIKERKSTVYKESYQMPFTWEALSESTSQRIREDFYESSQGLYYHVDYEYGVDIPFIVRSIDHDEDKKLYQIAGLYRHPVSFDQVNKGFLIDLNIHEHFDEVIEQLVAHSYGYSTWRYLDQEYEFSDLNELDQDALDTYESVNIEHKSVSKAHDDIVFKIIEKK